MVSASSPAADPRPATRVRKSGSSDKPPDPAGPDPAGQDAPVPSEAMLDEALDLTFPASDPIAPPESDGPVDVAAAEAAVRPQPKVPPPAGENGPA